MRMQRREGRRTTNNEEENLKATKTPPHLGGYFLSYPVMGRSNANTK
jgi:hypothetical protein